MKLGKLNIGDTFQLSDWSYPVEWKIKAKPYSDSTQCVVIGQGTSVELGDNTDVVLINTNFTITNQSILTRMFENTNECVSWRDFPSWFVGKLADDMYRFGFMKQLLHSPASELTDLGIKLYNHEFNK